MNTENKNTRPGVGAPKRVTEMKHITILQADYITDRNGKQATIAPLLMHGPGNAVPLKHLTKITQMSNREVRRAITAERMNGIPILSDNSNGYYFPESAEEVKAFVKSMKHRACEIQKVARAVEKSISDESVMEGLNNE